MTIDYIGAILVVQSIFSDYKEDPYSEDNPCNTICCRADLMDVDPQPDGCYDTKVSSRSLL